MKKKLLVLVMAGFLALNLSGCALLFGDGVAKYETERRAADGSYIWESGISLRTNRPTITEQGQLKVLEAYAKKIEGSVAPADSNEAGRKRSYNAVHSDFTMGGIKNNRTYTVYWDHSETNTRYKIEPNKQILLPFGVKPDTIHLYYKRPRDRKEVHEAISIQYKGKRILGGAEVDFLCVLTEQNTYGGYRY